MTHIYAISAVGLVAALLGGLGYMILAGQGDDRFAACRAARVAGGTMAIGGPFTLVDGAGRAVTEADVIVEPTILYFGYTFCPDVCPLDNARNADAVDILEEMGIAATPVFVTVDPKRDTPEVMGDYAALMHPKMIGLSGPPEAVAAAGGAYRVYSRAQEGDPDYYLVDHTTFSYLALPDHGVVEVFRRDIGADDMAKAVACFAEVAG